MCLCLYMTSPRLLPLNGRQVDLVMILQLCVTFQHFLPGCPLRELSVCLSATLSCISNGFHFSWKRFGTINLPPPTRPLPQPYRYNLQLQGSSRAVSEQLQSDLNIEIELFRTQSTPISEWWQEGVKEFTERFQSGSRAITEQFQSSLVSLIK